MASDVAYHQSKAQIHRRAANEAAETRIAGLHREIAEHHEQIIRLNRCPSVTERKPPPA